MILSEKTGLMFCLTIPHIQDDQVSPKDQVFPGRPECLVYPERLLFQGGTEDVLSHL